MTTSYATAYRRLSQLHAAERIQDAYARRIAARGLTATLEPYHASAVMPGQRRTPVGE